MSVTKITKDNFQELVLNADREVLLDFWAPWCGELCCDYCCGASAVQYLPVWHLYSDGSADRPGIAHDEYHGSGIYCHVCDSGAGRRDAGLRRYGHTHVDQHDYHPGAPDPCGLCHGGPDQKRSLASWPSLLAFHFAADILDGGYGAVPGLLLLGQSKKSDSSGDGITERSLTWHRFRIFC